MANIMEQIKINKLDLAFDMDDVLVPFSHEICRVMNTIGERAVVSDYITYNFPKYHGLSFEQFRDAINTSDVYSNMKPFKRAIETLHALSSQGFRLHIVTARGGFKAAERRTTNWINRHNAPIQSLSVMGHLENDLKSNYFKSMSPLGVGILVDDAPHNILDVVANAPDVLPIVVTQPWNKQHKEINALVESGKVVRIGHVSELVERLVYEPIKNSNVA